MKRFLVFSFDNYYPSGGWHDFIGSKNTLRKAILLGQKDSCWNWHVVDTESGEIVHWH